MRRGFGDNRDGNSIMRNGMPLVQGRSLNALRSRASRC